LPQRETAAPASAITVARSRPVGQAPAWHLLAWSLAARRSSPFAGKRHAPINGRRRRGGAGGCQQQRRYDPRPSAMPGTGPPASKQSSTQQSRLRSRAVDPRPLDNYRCRAFVRPWAVCGDEMQVAGIRRIGDRVELLEVGELRPLAGDEVLLEVAAVPPASVRWRASAICQPQHGPRSCGFVAA
jgi:hypothetical protein